MASYRLVQRIVITCFLLAGCSGSSNYGLSEVCSNEDKTPISVAGYLMVVEGTDPVRTILVENADGSGRFVGLDAAPKNLPPPQQVVKIAGTVQRSEGACSILLETISPEEN